MNHDNYMSLFIKLTGSKQYALVLVSIAIPLLISLVLVFTSLWQKEDRFKYEYEGYIDKEKFDLCIKEAKVKKAENLYENIFADLACKRKWMSKKTVKVEPSYLSLGYKEFKKYFLETIAIALMVYVTLNALILYLKCNNLGWKRLAILVSVIPAVLLVDIIHGFGNSGLKLVLPAFVGYVLGVLIILGGRRLVLWVKEGFKASSVD